MNLYERCVNTLALHICSDLEEALESPDGKWRSEMVDLILVQTEAKGSILPSGEIESKKCLSVDHPLILLDFWLNYGQKAEEYLRDALHGDVQPLPKELEHIESSVKHFLENKTEIMWYPEACQIHLTLKELNKIHNLKCEDEISVEDGEWFIKELVDFDPKDILAECKVDVGVLSKKNRKFLMEYRLRGYNKAYPPRMVRKFLFFDWNL